MYLLTVSGYRDRGDMSSTLSEVTQGTMPALVTLKSWPNTYSSAEPRPLIGMLWLRSEVFKWLPAASPVLLHLSPL